MKRKLIEQTEPKESRKKGTVITAQTAGELLILNIFQNGKIRARYGINSVTYEHEAKMSVAGEWKWRRWKFESVYELEKRNFYSGYMREKDVKFESQEDRDLICSMLKKEHWMRDVLYLIDAREREYSIDMREKKEYRRQERVKEIMNRVPEVPGDIGDWITKRAAGETAYFFFSKGEWICTECGGRWEEQEVKRADGGRLRHGDKAVCPGCGKTCQTMRRTNKKSVETHFCLMQPIDDEISVVRHFDAEIVWSCAGRNVKISESVRITPFKPKSKKSREYRYEVYYSQSAKKDSLSGIGKDYFDNCGNQQNRRIYTEYLYDGGIREAFKGTWYEKWTGIFEEMAAAGLKANYNRMMAAKDEQMAGLIEMLYKGRFYRLVEEETEQISCWNGEYIGTLHLQGKRIEEVFGIQDRQEINRIREMKGGSLMIKWIRWSEQNIVRLSSKVLLWLCENQLSEGDMRRMMIKMSPERCMNYIERQKQESYQGESAKEVVSQYEDYMSMSERLKKNTSDEMVFRPRELKRRHDEAVKAIEEMDAELLAEEYTRRFPGVEDVLEEIREKYEYASEKYIITVPRRCVDIILDSRALHHCAGSADRYFDRIKQHETYICFLHRSAEPDKPYYTIEVEPGGSIRQHRGYLDEEPEIKEIRPFLRQWQRAIKGRMSAEDKERARISAIKRQKNIEELKAKNNTRVLQGLMEDFMEAV